MSDSIIYQEQEYGRSDMKEEGLKHQRINVA